MGLAYEALAPIIYPEVEKLYSEGIEKMYITANIIKKYSSQYDLPNNTVNVAMIAFIIDCFFEDNKRNFSKVNKIDFESLLKSINFNEFFVEATFQYYLMMKLSHIIDESNIFPERNIRNYGLKSKKYTKKVIDIVLENEKGFNIAIELKMPMNGQFPEQMYSFVKDIKFLEELKESGKFKECYLITMAKNKNFWSGQINNGIYAYFRDNKILTGRINKPTGKNKGIEYYKISGKYKIKWKIFDKDFRYFILKI
jgi:hypothetical protein